MINNQNASENRNNDFMKFENPFSYESIINNRLNLRYCNKKMYYKKKNH